MNSSNISNRYKDRRVHRQEHRDGRNWIIGIVLILIGGFILLQNMRIYTLNNWWVLFILIPALGAFADALRHAQESGGKFTKRARSAFLVGIALVALTAMFLLDLNATIFGPILLVLTGIGMIVNGMFRD